MERLSRRQIAEIGVAGVLAFGSVEGCGTAPTTPKPTGIDNLQPCIVRTGVVPSESPTAYLVNPADFDNLEEQALEELSTEFNIDIVEYVPTAIPAYLFAYDPGAKEMLKKSLAFFPDSLYSTKYSYNGRIELRLDMIDGGDIKEPVKEDVYVPASDIEPGDRDNLVTHLEIDLADGLAQRKDDESGNLTTNEIIKILGSDQAVENLGLLQSTETADEAWGAPDASFSIFPKNADGKINRSKIVGTMAKYYVLGEKFFVYQIGSVISPGVSTDSPDYSSSKIKGVYDAMTKLFSKTYPNACQQSEFPTK